MQSILGENIKKLFVQDDNKLAPIKVLMCVGTLIILYNIASTELAGRIIGLVFPTCYFYKFLSEYSNPRSGYTKEMYMFDVKRTSHYFVCYVHLELFMCFIQARWLFTLASVFLVYIFESHTELLEELYTKCVNLDKLIMDTIKTLGQKWCVLLTN